MTQAAHSSEALAILTAVSRERGLGALASRLAELQLFLATDLSSIEQGLSSATAPDTDVVTSSASHLIACGGKRLRPICVVLASRVGRGFDERARELAIAVELVHAATLLHDDVVDDADVRRGAPAARTIYGNAASIFAGDWLLVEALRRVRRAEVPGTLDPLLTTIETMIAAEALQLERRGRIVADLAAWASIAEGKTAALFQWAMLAGARAGGLDDASTSVLERFGRDVGVAFQAADDVLDLRGDAARTGKLLFTDLREGKMTWPLCIALDRDVALRRMLEAIAAAPPGTPVDATLAGRVLGSVERTGAVDDCLARARSRAHAAAARLTSLPACAATRALETVALAAVDRAS